MKDNPKLPARHYFKLSQAAEELDCTPEYLVHAASIGAVQLMARPPFRTAVNARVIYLNESGELMSDTLLDWTDMSWEFVLLSGLKARFIEEHGSTHVSTIVGEWPIGSTMLGDYLSPEVLIAYPKHHALLLDIDTTPNYLDNGKIAPPGEETTGFEVKQDDLWVSAEETERLKRGEPADLVNNTPPDIAARLEREPSPKRRNSYARTIAALSQALVGSLSGKPYKDAGVILKAMSVLNVAAPVDEACLANYLKEAAEAGQKAKG